MTSHERAAWNEVRRSRLVVEIDGSVHDFSDETVRTGYLESRGFTVLRFTNDEVEEYGVEGTILNWLDEHPRPPARRRDAPPPEPGGPR